MSTPNTRSLTRAAAVGALYAALTLSLSFISFGPVQYRVAEALCVLPVFMPEAVWGLFAGCALSNLIGGFGLPDVVFGSLATLGACLCVVALARRGGSPMGVGRAVAVCLMPVLWNGPVVGAVVAWGAGIPLGAGWLLIMAQIAAEEAAVMLTLGLAVLRLLPRSEALMRLVRE